MMQLTPINRKIKLIKTALIIAFLSLFSCNSSQSKIERVEDKITSIENNDKSIDAIDIENLGKEIVELQKNVDAHRSDYTDEQIKEIGKLQGRYASIALKKGMNDMKQKIEDFGKQMEGFVEGITDTTNK